MSNNSIHTSADIAHAKRPTKHEQCIARLKQIANVIYDGEGDFFTDLATDLMHWEARYNDFPSFGPGSTAEMHFNAEWDDHMSIMEARAKMGIPNPDLDGEVTDD